MGVLSRDYIGIVWRNSYFGKATPNSAGLLDVLGLLLGGQGDLVSRLGFRV